MEEGGGGARTLVPRGPVLLVLCGLLKASGGGRVLPPLSDDIPFRVNWPGTEFSLPTTGVLYKEDNYVIMTTAHKEKYKCILPLVTSGDEEEEKDYKGPNPRELLEPLFKQSSCSYRIESYWTYEVCHGKHIRQYHEEKETGQKINIHEYYLGNMLAKNLLSEKEREAEEMDKSNEIPTKNIEGQMTPYYPVGMGNGTPCSLKQNRPRSSTVMYICHPESKHEILSVAEVTTCEYEVVILTPLLCNHPKYRFRASPVNDIFCQSLPGSPFKPLTLRQLEQQEEILRVPFRRSKEEDLQSTKEERFPAIHKSIAIGSQPILTVGTTHISKLTDDQLIKEFLSGSYCFHGGVGWWKYEFCYGKHVHQYHEDKDSGKISVVVGTHTHTTPFPGVFLKPPCPGRTTASTIWYPAPLTTRPWGPNFVLSWLLSAGAGERSQSRLRKVSVAHTFRALLCRPRPRKRPRVNTCSDLKARQCPMPESSTAPGWPGDHRLSLTAETRACPVALQYRAAQEAGLNVASAIQTLSPASQQHSGAHGSAES